MPTLIIDGQEVHAQEGQTVLEAARDAGIDIPTLCYHPLLETQGSCRICTVEVIRRGRSTLQTACTYPAWDGLEIRTHSPSVIKTRQTIIGLLLSRCPDVPIIQDLGREYGVTEPLFPPEKPDEKCILCGLCVRTCHELVKADAINFSQRGIERRVGPPFLETTDQCIGCGACTIVCPTGAIDIVLEQSAVYDAKPLGPTSAIHVPSLQAVPRVPVIDTDACIRFRQAALSNGEITDACGVCQTLCEANAIDFTQQDTMVELDIGTIVVATGFAMWDPASLSQYAYGQSPNIITGLEFERLSNAGGPTGGEILLANGEKPKRVAIIHCVGSRDHNAHPYCSRICCMYALKQAHLVRDKTGADVYQFYMDMRAFGKGYEEFYERVQGEGVFMVRGKGAEVEVRPNGELRVKGENANLGIVISVDVDMVVLASAIESQPDADRVASLFGLSRSEDGFFAEAHPKLRPVETNTEGVFLAGVAQGPKDVPDTVAHAGAAASMALSLLDKGEVTISPTVSTVLTRFCTGCGKCIPVCPYTAISLGEDGKSVINAALCKGCGTCAAACPSDAIQPLHFTDDQLVGQIVGVLYE
ncbi:MAG: 4Fe-4S binding protein [Chloroflexi bacterium]|nr:4Fe-4S binding protein [Chloroflexota bacterium]